MIDYIGAPACPSCDARMAVLEVFIEVGATRLICFLCTSSMKVLGTKAMTTCGTSMTLGQHGGQLA